MAASFDCLPEEDCDSTVSSCRSEEEGEWKRDVSELMVQILTDITYSDPNDNHHCRFFDWLVDPLRTVEEIDFVIREEGPSFLKYAKSQNSRLRIYFGKVAAEALALICPILEGMWECVAWDIVKFGMEYKSSRYGFVSTNLSDWIVKMIGNAELCPNPNLRIQLMILLKNMVQVNDENQVLVLESVMSAFCGLCVQSKYMNGIPLMTISNISQILKIFTTRGYIMIWDLKLCRQLSNLQTSRISIILKDVSFATTLNPTRYANPRELFSLITLFKFTVDYAQNIIKEKETNQFDFDKIYELREVVQLLHLMIDRFSTSCQMPVLITLTLSSIVSVLESILLFSLNAEDVDILDALTSIEWMFRKSTYARTIIIDNKSHCEGRLVYIRNSWYNIRKDEYATDSDDSEEINQNARSHYSLRDLLEKSNYSMFTNICMIVFNEYFDESIEPPNFDNELIILSPREILSGEIVSDNEISSDDETSSDSDMSFVDWP